MFLEQGSTQTEMELLSMKQPIQTMSVYNVVSIN